MSSEALWSALPTKIENTYYMLIVASTSNNETWQMDTRYFLSFDVNEQLKMVIQNSCKVARHLQRHLVNVTRPDIMVSQHTNEKSLSRGFSIYKSLCIIEVTIQKVVTPPEM